MFNLRHSSLRVTVERVFGALKNKFKIFDQKPFHTSPTQVKLVLACCILHNWILEWGGVDKYFPEEEDVTPDTDDDVGHGIAANDQEAWKTLRQEMADAMWVARGDTRI